MRVKIGRILIYGIHSAPYVMVQIVKVLKSKKQTIIIHSIKLILNACQIKITMMLLSMRTFNVYIGNGDAAGNISAFTSIFFTHFASTNNVFLVTQLA